MYGTRRGAYLTAHILDWRTEKPLALCDEHGTFRLRITQDLPLGGRICPRCTKEEKKLRSLT